MPFPTPGDLPDPGIEPVSLASAALTGGFFPTEPPGKPLTSSRLSIAASLVAQLVKNPPAMCETWVRSLDWEDSLEKGRLPTPVFWPGEIHGLYSPWGHKESDTTERLSPTLYKVLFCFEIVIVHSILKEFT